MKCGLVFCDDKLSLSDMPVSSTCNARGPFKHSGETNEGATKQHNQTQQNTQPNEGASQQDTQPNEGASQQDTHPTEGVTHVKEDGGAFNHVRQSHSPSRPLHNQL